jgi:hypothetical protein
MFLLERLTSRSSRSIAVMIAFARSACGGRGGRMGSPDDDRLAVPFRIRPAPHFPLPCNPKVPADPAAGRRAGPPLPERRSAP